MKRVVLTSSIASVSGGHPRDKIFTEESWTDVTSKDVGAYEKSKVCFLASAQMSPLPDPVEVQSVFWSLGIWVR